MSGAMLRMRNGFCLFLMRSFVALIAFLAGVAPVIAQTPTGTPVENRAYLRFTNAGGGVDSMAAAVTMRVSRPSSVMLRKSVDKSAAGVGDTLVYTIRWNNTGFGPAGDVIVEDSLPASLSFIPGSVVSPSRVATTTITGRFLRVALGDIAAADSGSFTFSTIVREQGNGSADNTARVLFASEGLNIMNASDTAKTRLLAPQMRLELEALTDHPLSPGDTLTYRIRLYNTSNEVSLRNVTISDSLPAELKFLSAEPGALFSPFVAAFAAGPTAPAVFGGIVRWTFNEIAPLGMIEILLHTQVMAVGNGELINVTTANGDGIRKALAAVATVSVPAIALPDAEGLVIRKTASALEVANGDAVGFTITVQNIGTVTQADVIVHDFMDAGLNLQRNSVSGATVVQNGADTELHIGALAGGATTTVQYAATVADARGAVILNRAVAKSLKWTSDTAVVSMRVRNAAMLSRVVMGKVWLDENGDGRQQATERSLSNAIIWSSHGETVRADTSGRFTFPDMNAGRYTFRIDPLSVPAGFESPAPETRRVDGWSTPVVQFAVPRGIAVIAKADAPIGRSASFLAMSVVRPRPSIVAPANGSIIGTNKMFVRVEGFFEPDAMVKVTDNGKPIGEKFLRPDGSADFLDITVAPGPHKLAGVLTGTQTGVQTTSIDFHVSGAPKQTIRTDTATLRAGRTHVLALRVLDEWKQPVAQKPYATVGTRGMRVLDADVDPSSVGTQLEVDSSGTLLVRVAGDSAGVAHMNVAFGSDDTSLDVIMLPEIRSLVLLADGEIGAGATSKSYGSAVARGSIDDRTSVTLSYDSRRTRDNAFGGAFDPLGESRMPILGDASQRTVVGSATSPLSLRVERDRGWLLLGDIDTRGFGSDNSPAAYRRMLPGVSGHMLSGPVDVFGFGSMVAQQIVQKQLRGDGTSGPYHLGGEIRLGTDRVVIETRDRLNASLVISRQELERFVDYDIDATTGSILLRRPLASSDASGNSLFIVALAEQINGASSFVGGLHAQVTASPFKTGSDTVRIGGGYIEDQSPLGGHTLMSAELGASTRFGGSSLEIARGETADSAGIALHASAWLGSIAGSNASVQWSRVGDGFANPANPRLISGTEDIRLAANAALGNGWTAGGSYNRQLFRSRGAERAQSSLTIGRTQGENKLSLDVGVMDEKLDQDTLHASYSSLTTRLMFAQKRNTAWLESTQPLQNNGPARPTTYGVGVSYDLGHGIRAEASQRIVKADSTSYGVSSVALRSEFSTGTRAWSEYELTNGVNGETSAALVGIGQKLRVSDAWSIDAQYERRAGLSKLPETDPSRALPFTQQEQNRWATSLGAEFTPAGNKVRAGLRAELHDGDQTGRGYRIFGSGEASINSSLTLLAREDSREDRRTLNTGVTVTRSSQSILAAAFRPAARSDWNSLVKLELRNDENPQRAGGALLAGSNRRVIGAGETIWTPSTQTEIGLRYAFRNSVLGGLFADNSKISANTQYAGAHIRQQLNDRFDVRVAGRLMAETNSGLTRFDLSPAAGVKLIQGLDLEAGYRFGDLRDVDFAQNGGHGFYATLGMSITEKTGHSIAEFWRNRIGGGR